MIVQEPLQITGKGGREIHLDLTYFDQQPSSEVLVFSHGFKGFKDWGAFNLMAYEFAKRGLTLIKFNFSHNGVSGPKGEDISDLDTFSKNKLTTELNELHLVISYTKDLFLEKFGISANIFLLGHSRGGSLSLLAGVENPLVKKVVSMGAVSTFDRPEYNREDFISKWKQEGVIYIKNMRTLQELPMSYDYYQDYLDHFVRLDITTRLSETYKPLMIIHGE